MESDANRKNLMFVIILLGAVVLVSVIAIIYQLFTKHSKITKNNVTTDYIKETIKKDDYKLEIS